MKQRQLSSPGSKRFFILCIVFCSLAVALVHSSNNKANATDNEGKILDSCV